MAPHQEPRPLGTLRVPDSTIRGRRSAPPPFSTITWLPEPRSENIVKILNDRQNRCDTARSIPRPNREPSFNKKDVSFSRWHSKNPGPESYDDFLVGEVRTRLSLRANSAEDEAVACKILLEKFVKSLRRTSNR